ncbi:molecular chaperone Tir [Herbaspirillum hiltneri N3]|uniref:Molecular chaperone Tir n=1 Tax=Herbaspirillum hiltneri N3 TaxID=1262470 RepID=A0ABN4HYQ6_9BURK|nr:CesT family type III secretion system chaperone [Herbaspirillum hiltneri]AKZ62894.1 molecular chaperone Tir [Herbaspirillum hiltneri N3]
MENHIFRSFVDAIAALANVPRPVGQRDHARLELDGVIFTLMEGSGLDAGTVAYLCDFGALPDTPDRAEILQCLLECNLLMFGVDTPAFAVNSETDHVMLTGRARLAGIDARKLLAAFVHFSAQARRWQKTYFLDGRRKVRSKTQHRLLAASEN